MKIIMSEFGMSIVYLMIGFSYIALMMWFIGEII